MKIKIGNKIYNDKDEPIMIILTDVDRKNILNMIPNAKKYASFPDDYGDEKKMREWMKTD